MSIDRRDFLKAVGVAGAATAMPWGWMGAGASPRRAGMAADLTTLNGRIVKGLLAQEGQLGSYYLLTMGPSEPHLLRTELSSAGARHAKPMEAKRSLVHFAHFTDIHIVDAQSPARVEFLDRFNDVGQGCEGMPFNSAYRPQEQLTLHILEAMIRRMRAIEVSPLTGEPIQSVVCTGDNIDNEQFNELRWFIDTMDGGTVSVNSGADGVYEGVQSAEWADVEYWHPDGDVDDKYKQLYGFPNYDGLLEAALKPFEAQGVGVPWYQTFGNHDGLLQGNAPRNPVFEAIAVGGTKARTLPPGVNPCDAFATMQNNPTAFLAAPAAQVTSDPDRKIVTRAEYIEEMFNTTASPSNHGHGFTQENRDNGTAYWSSDDHPGFRFIGLDTVNPGGYNDGSIGAAQLTWMEDRLREVSKVYLDSTGEEVTQDDVDDKLVIIFSHHGLRSLDSPASNPDPLEPGANDLPRKTSEEIEALVHRYPNVIAWVNGHSHLNVVVPRPRPGNDGGFWDIGTAAHIDWSCQSRLVEVIDNRDGTLSIFCTMFDHAAPVTPGAGDHDVLRIASISRELAANDPQAGFGTGEGEHEDRNVELVIKAPFDVSKKTFRKRRPKLPSTR